MSWSVLKDAYHLQPRRVGGGVLLNTHAQFAHHLYGRHIPSSGRRDNPLEVKQCERIVDQGLRRLGGVSLALIGRGKGILEAKFRRVQVGKGILGGGLQGG
jgi:hypothetical protein